MGNTIRTTLLLGVLTGLFMMIGNALGGTGGMVIALLFAVAMNMGAWWFSDKMALAMSGAKEAPQETYPALHRSVERLAQNAGIPKPRVFIIETHVPNAFATGRSPQRGAVAVTSGIMSLLSADELDGVIAHELAHIKHRDTLISSLAATIGGAITMIADMAMWAMIFGGFGGDDEDDGVAGMVGGVFMLILAPIASLIIQMAISRGREYLADESGAQIAGDPLALANALAKIESWAHSGAAPAERMNPATSHLYIIPPMGGGLASLFRTHPPTEERIRRLQALAGQPSSMMA